MPNQVITNYLPVTVYAPLNCNLTHTFFYLMVSRHVECGCLCLRLYCMSCLRVGALTRWKSTRCDQSTWAERAQFYCSVERNSGRLERRPSRLLQFRSSSTHFTSSGHAVAKYFHKETDKTHRWKIKVTYKDEDQEQERECGDLVSTTKQSLWNLKRHVSLKHDGCTYYAHMLKELNVVGR